VDQLKILSFVLLGALNIPVVHLGLDPVLCRADQWGLFIAAGMASSDGGRGALANRVPR
jgi:hypothetical protein